jgi:hypothetical protein
LGWKEIKEFIGSAVAYLSCETVKWLKVWLDHAKISEGPIFRRLIGRTLLAAHNQRNQIVVASLKRRTAVRECTAGGVNQIKYVQVA